MKGKGAVICLLLGNVFAMLIPILSIVAAVVLTWTWDEFINDVLPRLGFYFLMLAPVFVIVAATVASLKDEIRMEDGDILRDLRRRKSYRWEPWEIKAAKANEAERTWREAERCRRRRARQLAFKALRHVVAFRLFEPIAKTFETAIWLGTAIVAVSSHVLLCAAYGPAMWLLAFFVLVCLVVMFCWTMIHNAWEVSFLHLTKHQRHARDLSTMSARGTADVLLWYLRPWTRPTMQ